MRVTSDVSQLTIAPGKSGSVPLEIANTGTVIDGITAGVVGLNATTVTTHPAVLPLFPDAVGQLTVTITLPVSFPAGRHPVTIEVLSRQPDIEPAYFNLLLVVPRQPGMGITSRPELVRAHRTGRFIVTVTNRGNTMLDIDLSIADAEKKTTAVVQPSVMSLAASTSAESVITVQAGRHIMGADIDHGVVVEAKARAVDPNEKRPATDSADDDGSESKSDDDEASAPILQQRAITFRQRPYISRGLLTAGILAAIVAVWAAVFLFGLARVFAGDPLVKMAPSSFFAATAQTDDAAASSTGAAPSGGPAGSNGADSSGQAGAPASGDNGSGSSDPGGTSGSAGSGSADSGSAGSGGGAAAGAKQNAVPAGALPKKGTLPAGVGGTISGTVTAASSGQPVGRILVEALRVRADGSLAPGSSAATQSDGTYQVAGLFPAPYVLRFSAPGFVTSYYPATTDVKSAKTVNAVASTITTAGNGVVTGLPATIHGKVDPGDATGTVVTTVSIQILQQGSGQAITIPDVTTNPSDHSYVVPNLPAPGTYQLTFSTPGYEDTSITSFVTGGADRYESTAVLSAGNAQISGMVTDGTKGLGGATVSTTVDGKVLKTGTPTDGNVGAFVLNNLPTPATYVVTVSRDGYGQVSQVINLAPGQPQNDLKIALHPGSGVVQGRLVDANDVGIGGAKVTVGGLADAPSTVTVTDGAVGTFRLSGLPTPGSYTLTFSKDGYADQIVPVELEENKALTPITVTMAASMGSISGTVTGTGGAPVTGATVTATDGQKSWPVITTGNSDSGKRGSYAIAGLPEGVYTVTATDAAGHSQTQVTTVSAGDTVSLSFQLAGGA